MVETEKTGKGSSVVGGWSVSGRAVMGDGGMGVPGVRGVLGWAYDGDGGGRNSELDAAGESNRADPGGEWFDCTRFRCEGDRDRERNPVGNDSVGGLCPPCGGCAGLTESFGTFSRSAEAVSSRRKAGMLGRRGGCGLEKTVDDGGGEGVE